jgi:hypothetical protein
MTRNDSMNGRKERKEDEDTEMCSLKRPQGEEHERARRATTTTVAVKRGGRKLDELRVWTDRWMDG